MSCFRATQPCAHFMSSLHRGYVLYLHKWTAFLTFLRCRARRWDPCTYHMSSQVVFALMSCLHLSGCCAQTNRIMRCTSGVPAAALFRRRHRLRSRHTPAVEIPRSCVRSLLYNLSPDLNLQEYPDRILSTFSILPSPKVSSLV